MLHSHLCSSSRLGEFEVLSVPKALHSAKSTRNGFRSEKLKSLSRRPKYELLFEPESPTLCNDAALVILKVFLKKKKLKLSYSNLKKKLLSRFP